MSCPHGFDGHSCINKRFDNDNKKMEDEYEMQICQNYNCSYLASDGTCNSECNYFACQYDGGDCSAHTTPFASCPMSKHCARVFKNGKCDKVSILCHFIIEEFYW